jgi:hypothetical protein
VELLDHMAVLFLVFVHSDCTNLHFFQQSVSVLFPHMLFL